MKEVGNDVDVLLMLLVIVRIFVVFVIVIVQFIPATCNEEQSEYKNTPVPLNPITLNLLTSTLILYIPSTTTPLNPISNPVTKPP